MSTVLAPIVLYAEDDENDVFFMERAFSKLKRRDTLHIVSNGRDAVDYLSAQGSFSERSRFPQPDILILDLKMPEMSGLEVLKWTREQAQFRTLPIILFTSSTQHTDIEFSRRHDANAFLVKPSNAEHLSVLVNKILDTCSADSVANHGVGVVNIEGNQLKVL